MSRRAETILCTFIGFLVGALTVPPLAILWSQYLTYIYHIISITRGLG